MPKLSQTERIFYEFVGTRIRQLRLSAKGHGITQSQLARELGVKQNTVSRWESGEFRPTMLDVQALARFFDVSIARLFCEDGDSSLDGRINEGLRDLTEKDRLEMLMLIKIKGELSNCDQQQLRDRLDQNLRAIQG